MKNADFVTIARHQHVFYLSILGGIHFRDLLPPIKYVLNYTILKNYVKS